MRGRKQLSTHLKGLRGTRQKCRETPGLVDVQAPSSPPVMPTSFTKLEKAVWNHHAPTLIEAGLLTILDREMFVGYCTAVVQAREATKQLKKDGTIIKNPVSGLPMKHPAWSILKDAILLVHKLGSEFGLTPASRLRIKVPEKKIPSKFEKFLKNGEATCDQHG